MTRADALRDMKAIFDDHEKEGVEELGRRSRRADPDPPIRRDVVSAIATPRPRSIRQIYPERH